MFKYYLIHAENHTWVFLHFVGIPECDVAGVQENIFKSEIIK